MAALTQDRKTDQYGATRDPTYLPIAANTVIYAGAIVCVNASGLAVPGAVSTTLRVAGRCEEQVLNNPGAAGSATAPPWVKVRPGIFFFNSGTAGDAIVEANVGFYCYVIDDNTVGLTTGGATRSIAGVIYTINPNGQIGVLMGFGVATAQGT